MNTHQIAGVVVQGPEEVINLDEAVARIYEAGFRATIKATQLRFPTGLWRCPTDGSLRAEGGRVASKDEFWQAIQPFIPNHKNSDAVRSNAFRIKVLLALSHLNKGANAHTGKGGAQ